MSIICIPDYSVSSFSVPPFSVSSFFIADFFTPFFFMPNLFTPDLFILASASVSTSAAVSDFSTLNTAPVLTSAPFETAARQLTASQPFIKKRLKKSIRFSKTSAHSATDAHWEALHFKNFPHSAGHKKKQFIFYILLPAFLMFLCLFSLCFFLTLQARSIYAALITPLGIEESSGLSRQEILINYHYLIDYCSPFFTGILQFPTLPSSPSAISHFAEVKLLFQNILFSGILCGISAAAVLHWSSPEQKKRILHLTSLLCLLFPAVFLLLLFSGFHSVFVQLHHLLFQNEDWLFSPAADPVILLLPERYFLFCACFIVVLLCACGFVLHKLSLSSDKAAGDASLTVHTAPADADSPSELSANSGASATASK